MSKEFEILSLPVTFEVDSSFDSERFIKLRLRVCHDSVNPNGSAFTVECMDNAKDSIKNIPLLAHVIFDDNGDPQFGSHDMHIEEDKVNDGEYRIIYDEIPIGGIPETNEYEIKEFDGRNYVYVSAYAWRDYIGYAEDIIERDTDIKISMEILVNSYTYDGKKKVYNITDYTYKGITLLGNNVGTGMLNALATMGDFADKKEKLINLMSELTEELNKINFLKVKEEKEDLDEKLKILEKYDLTVDQLGFEIKDISIEDLEAKMEEMSQTNKDEKFTKTFELSHEDIRYSLYQLLYPVENDDNEWYYIDKVYDDKFEYQGLYEGHIYRQSYEVADDDVSFDGDRIEIYQERLTAEEKEVLDNMRSSYEGLQSDFEQYKETYKTSEVEVEKLRKFQSEKLELERKEAESELFGKFDEQLKDVEEYKQLKEKSGDYTLDELEEKCCAIFGRAQFNFNLLNLNPTNLKVPIDTLATKSDDAYGGIRDTYLNENQSTN